MLKKALRSLIRFGKNKGANDKSRSIIPFRSRLSLEGLEDRRLLAAFDLSAYEEHHRNTNLSGTTDDDFSGVVYHEPTLSFFIIDNGANSDNGRIHQYKYDANFDLVHQTRVIDFKNFDTDPDDGIKPGDPEGITWMGGDKFAFVRERSGFMHEFWIDADGTVDADSDVDGDSDSNDITDEVDKNGGSISTITPNPDPSRDNNQGLEGIAYDGDRNVFYVVKERTWLDLDGQNGTEIIYEVAMNGTVTPIHVAGLTSELSGRDVSDVYYANDHIFIITERGLNQITRITWNPTNSAWEFDTNDDDDIRDGAKVPAGQPEAITFSTDGFDMFVVGEPREFFHYRNYTSFTPNAAPDMTDLSDTRTDGDNITTDTTPTFTGTLTRTVGGNTVPLDAATVFLYVDGVEKGTAETDEDGFYSVTSSALNPGAGQIVTIKVGESAFEEGVSEATIEANQSIASATVNMTIAATDHFADLTIDGFVDADDLFVLLANWNSLGGPELGDLFIDPLKPGINADDLFVLLANWTGPDPTAGPQAAKDVIVGAVLSASGNATVFSTTTSISIDFGQAVSGVTVDDMVLTGTGAVGATVDSVSEFVAGSGVWAFEISGLSVGTIFHATLGNITKVDGGGAIDEFEDDFIAMPGVTLTAGALDVNGTSLMVPQADRGLNVSAGYAVAA